MRNRKQQQKVMLLLMPLQKLIINSKRILQRIKKIQIRQILKMPMILIMYIRTVLLKVQEPDTVGTITVQVTLEDDTITAVSVVSAPSEDSAYLSQGENVINSIISEQSTDVDTISGATFSSTGILEAVNDALSKAENA